MRVLTVIRRGLSVWLLRAGLRNNDIIGSVMLELFVFINEHFTICDLVRFKRLLVRSCTLVIKLLSLLSHLRQTKFKDSRCP